MSFKVLSGPNHSRIPQFIQTGEGWIWEQRALLLFLQVFPIFGGRKGNNEGSSARAGMAMTSCHPSSLRGDIPILSIPLSLSSPVCSPSPFPPWCLWNITAPGDFPSRPRRIPGFNLSMKTCGRTSGNSFFSKFFSPIPFSPSFHQAWEWADNSKVVICRHQAFLFSRILSRSHRDGIPFPASSLRMNE